MKTYITKSREATIELGARLAKGFEAGDVIALIGELGSGKTTLVKGIAKGLGVKNSRYVNSPSFVIIKEYLGKIPLYHFDVFRLQTASCSRHLNVGYSSLSPMDALGFEEYFYGKGICVVEWADKIRELLPKKYIEVKIKIAEKDKRKIEITYRHCEPRRGPSLRGVDIKDVNTEAISKKRLLRRQRRNQWPPRNDA